MRNHALRKGKELAFTSPDGAEHPDMFWCLSKIGIEIDDTALRLHFIGYHDVAAYDAGKEPVAGAMRAYLISGAGFETAAALLTSAADTPISAEILRLAWEAALATEDVEDREHEGEMISFFDGAVDVE
jgi:hypothetical protein